MPSPVTNTCGLNTTATSCRSRLAGAELLRTMERSRSTTQRAALRHMIESGPACASCHVTETVSSSKSQPRHRVGE